MNICTCFFIAVLSLQRAQTTWLVISCSFFSVPGKFMQTFFSLSLLSVFISTCSLSVPCSLKNVHITQEHNEVWGIFKILKVSRFVELKKSCYSFLCVYLNVEWNTKLQDLPSLLSLDKTFSNTLPITQNVIYHEHGSSVNFHHRRL